MALIEGSVDAIVHSLKDVPTELPPGCELGAVLEREDPSDALVVKAGLSYTSLEQMPDGSVIGTSSVRRVAQLRRRFPKLKFADVVRDYASSLGELKRHANLAYIHLNVARTGSNSPTQAGRPQLFLLGSHPRISWSDPSRSRRAHHRPRHLPHSLPCRRPGRDRSRAAR